MAASAIFDRISGFAVLLLGIGAVWHGVSLKVAFAADPVGPKAFPVIVGLILLVCGASIALRPTAMAWEVGDYGRILLVAVASLIYPFILIPLGFVPATAILGFLCALAFKGRPLPSLVGAVALALVIFALIDLGLGLGLPRGPLGM
ncbi:tripartite tricarboxylate transporter TctB family protein [Aureimonas psammosilenae]|uniref:tripartite tricarboxylate transporter TctB family protein n=1 Tax=Aureimonas psammosilenae TaxID=2495496 RepID=UPI00126102C1|nr:tripartite tricarboxylate transporter TctB family protein [Aureimonas psammosilenae]